MAATEMAVRVGLHHIFEKKLLHNFRFFEFWIIPACRCGIHMASTSVACIYGGKHCTRGLLGAYSFPVHLPLCRDHLLKD